MIRLVRRLTGAFARKLFRSRLELMVENLALPQQLAVFKQRHCRPRLRPADRVFRLFWRLISRAQRVGRPRILGELRELIGRMARENGWGAPRIHGELLQLGLRIDESTVSRYLPRGRNSPDKLQRRLVFLRNHRDSLVGMDFFTVPTVTFRLLWVFVVLHHERGRILHFAVTEYPEAPWIIEQLREAFPFDTARRYAILDRDGRYGHAVPSTLQNLGVELVRTGARSPWQKPCLERFGGTLRRQLLDKKSSCSTQRSFTAWCVNSLPIITRTVVIWVWRRMRPSPG